MASLILVNASTALSISDIAKRAKLLESDAEARVPVRATQSGGANSVDPATYIIGGGDKVSISVLNMPSERYEAVISPDGSLLIPDLGMVRIGLIPLSAAVEKIKGFMAAQVKGANEVIVTLAETKRASVTVTGAISNPGTYEIPANHRLLDVLIKANNNSLPSYDHFDYRNIRVQGKLGKRVIDLFQFLIGGDISANPYVYPGDQITLGLAQKTIYLGGYVKSHISGTIPLRDQETAGDLLSMYPLDEAADSNHIIFMRRDGGSPKILTYDELQSIHLSHGDALIVASKRDFESLGMITIDGEVQRPGLFPIKKHKTTASEIIALAGGILPEADTTICYIIRKSSLLKQGHTNSLSNAVFQPEILSIRPSLTSSLYRLVQTGDYSIITLSGTKDQTELTSGDHIVIPKIEKHIYISGNVNKPGAYPYSPSKKPLFYINEAGGFTAKADKYSAFVVRRLQQQMQLRELSTLAAGDIIVVPEKEQFRRWNFFKEAIAVISAIATTSLVVLTIAKQ